MDLEEILSIAFEESLGIDGKRAVLRAFCLAQIGYAFWQLGYFLQMLHGQHVALPIIHATTINEFEKAMWKLAALQELDGNSSLRDSG